MNEYENVKSFMKKNKKDYSLVFNYCCRAIIKFCFWGNSCRGASGIDYIVQQHRRE
jgi:hypothetical protein